MRRFASLAAGLALLVLHIAACGGTGEDEASAGGGGTKLTLVAYTTPREVYDEPFGALDARWTRACARSSAPGYGACTRRCT
jgi:ABC-type sulfate transport system substrate-binding protein